jgi:ATPases involved in chromosome partitioning
MKDTVFYVGGSKGGVGKSMVSITLIQYLIDRFAGEKNISIIETDNGNPDVWRIYNNKLPVGLFSLDEDQKGWQSVADLIERTKNTLFVINSAALSNVGMEAHGRDFSTFLDEISDRCDFVTFWVLNRQKDSVLLLEDYLKVMGTGKLFVVRNNYWGPPEEFGLYKNMRDESEHIRIRVDGELDFPSLSDLVADEFYTGGRTVPETMNHLTMFGRISFKSWYAAACDMFDMTGIFDEVESGVVNGES